MILPKKDIVPNMLVANGSTLGVRIPNSKITNLLSSSASIPYTTPSANRTGEPTPYSIDEVRQVLDIEKVDLVLDAGPLPKIAPSTVIDISEGNFKILREGPIGREEIEKVLALHSK
jgi:L-threonylcarbamoyladenylate synthase